MILLKNQNISKKDNDCISTYSNPLKSSLMYMSNFKKTSF